MVRKDKGGRGQPVIPNLNPILDTYYRISIALERGNASSFLPVLLQRDLGMFFSLKQYLINISLNLHNIFKLIIIIKLGQN